MADRFRLPFSVKEKYICRLSLVPKTRLINPLSSTERITLEALELLSPSISAISPEERVPASDKLHNNMYGKRILGFLVAFV